MHSSKKTNDYSHSINIGIETKVFPVVQEFIYCDSNISFSETVLRVI